MPRLQPLPARSGPQCARCGEDLAGSRCPTCRARWARWTAYGIIGPTAILATYLDLRLGGRWHDSTLPALSVLLLATIGAAACIRAFSLTRDPFDKVLFVFGLVFLSCLLSFGAFYLWLAWAFSGG